MNDQQGSKNTIVEMIEIEEEKKMDLGGRREAFYIIVDPAIIRFDFDFIGL